MKLTLDCVETTPIRTPLAREFRGSFYRMTHRSTLVVRLRTAEGVVGEAYVGDEDATLHEIRRVLVEEIVPAAMGEDLFATERRWEAGYASTFDILRDRRIGLVALAAFDTAMWDAVGKALGQPLWRLWGGYRNEVPMSVIGGYYGQSLDSLRDEVVGYRESGFAGMKLKVGGLPPREDAARVAAVREAVGPEFAISIDANQGYSLPDAIEMARACADLDIRWFEEPVAWHNDRRALRDARYLGGLPVAAGQSEFSVSGCRDLMETGSIDFCNFDASWSGGPTAWLRMAKVAMSYDVQVAHHEEPQVSSHLIASQPHGTYAECFHPDRDPYWWNLIANRPELKDGFITLSEQPGLGWDLDWSYIKRYALD